MKNKLSDIKNLDAEKSIIAEIINNNESLSNIQNLKSKHFYSGKYKKLFKYILKLDQNNEPIDMITLSNKLDIKVSELTYFIGDSISQVKIKEYEKIIIDKWVRRELLKHGLNFSNIISKQGNDPSEIVTKYSKKFDNILEYKNKKEKLGDIEGALNELISKRVDGQESSQGIKTGFNGIDSKTGGFQPSDLITIGGDTSTGKTALSLNITENILFKEDIFPIGYISLELSKSGILDRMICTKSNININDFYRNEVTRQDRDRYQDVATQLNTKPFYIVDNISTLPDIQTKINLLYKNYETRIIFIDNIQNILSNSGEDFRKIISESTRTLKAIAKMLNITIVILSHLNRSKEPSKPPMLSHLKESSSIEQDSDKVILIHRPYKETTTENLNENCTLKFAKNRQGHTGNIDVIFNRKIARFENKNKF